MTRAHELLGRDTTLREIDEALAARRSVLLYGPEGIGKSAIIAAARRPGIVVLDPFEHVSRQEAAGMRRALDAGRVYLAAARGCERRALGAVGRVLWRFSLMRVRELPDALVRRIVAAIVDRNATVEHDTAWMAEMVKLSAGRPGFAVSMARFAVAWHRDRGYLPIPGFAFAAMREDAVIRRLRSAPAWPARRTRHSV